jgi:hypothetical protein
MAKIATAPQASGSSLRDQRLAGWLTVDSLWMRDMAGFTEDEESDPRSLLALLDACVSVK